MMGEFKFDYSIRIKLKRVIGSEYRWFTFIKDVFQGVTLSSCEKCGVEGFSSLSKIFNFSDLSDEEIEYNLLKMGLKKVPFDDIYLMPEIKENDNGVFCEHCYETEEMEGV